MSIDNPRLVLVDFTARLPDGSVIDTTQSEHSQGTPTKPLRPRLVSLGHPSFVVARGLERALEGAELNVPQTIEVEPRDAYGEWNRKLLRMVTARKLEDPEKSAVGDEIKINGRTGVIKFMSSGRVQIDYNHKYAGKKIRYDFTVTDLLDANKAKIEAILKEAGFGDEPDYELDESLLEIPIPNHMLKDERFQNKISQLQMNIFRFVSDLSNIQFTIEFTAPV